MNSNKNFTEFLPAEREEIETLQIQNSKFLELNKLKQFFNAIPNIFVVLNNKRQIIFTNKTLLDYVQKESLEDILGLRIGEILGCKHSTENPGGCGTTIFCSMCGAANAINNSLNGEYDIQECRIMLKNDDALDLKVFATPHNIEGEHFTIFAIQDIGDEKRRKALERIFFHDIINTAGGLRGFAELIKDYPEEVNEFKDIIYILTAKLIDEINAQKQLSAAERNELELNIAEVNSIELMNEIMNLYKNHDVADGKYIAIEASSDTVVFKTDEVLIRRVIGNMVKNALEASKHNQTVTIGCKKTDNEVIFSVNNPTFMPKEIQLQIFQRSFSTKGSSRGLGTYSMKDRKSVV